jgi:uncharacterized protein DUF3667
LQKLDEPAASAPLAAPSPTAPPAKACLNCGAELTGTFCAACGQRDIPPYPSVRELAVDAFWELSGWDGRFASTVRALVRHPGRLTLDFLQGRRARYISPLRLYLMTSLVYFLLAAAAPEIRLKSGKSIFVGIRIGTVTDAGGSDPDPADPSRLTPEQRAAALRSLDKAPRIVRPLFRQAISDPGSLRRRALQAMPRMLFALLPVFAGIVALFYRGRKYPEHLYFAIHVQAFVFTALGLIQLAKFTHAATFVVAVGTLVTLVLPIYTTIALRRVYGGGIAGTLVKEAGIGAIYSVAFAAGILLMGLVLAIGA